MTSESTSEAVTWEEAASEALAALEGDRSYNAWELAEYLEYVEGAFDRWLNGVGELGYLARDATRGWMKTANRLAGDGWDDDDHAQLVALLASKQHDYGHGNIDRFGIEGIKVRISDKICRLQNLLGRGDSVSNESLADTWLDIAGYCVIAEMLERGTFSLPLAADATPPAPPRVLYVHGTSGRHTWDLDNGYGNGDFGNAVWTLLTGRNGIQSVEVNRPSDPAAPWNRYTIAGGTTWTADPSDPF